MPKKVPSGYALGRLKKAVAFQAAARLALDDRWDIRDPDIATTNAVLSAIAHTDALTAACLERVNQQDHSAAVKLLRAALGNELPDTQERRLGRMLGRKDEASYGASVGRRNDAQNLLEELAAFGAWAIQALAERGVKIPASD